jgi:hypothetical protein
MWIPGGMIHAGAALVMLIRWLDSGGGVRERERAANPLG